MRLVVDFSVALYENYKGSLLFLCDDHVHIRVVYTYIPIIPVKAASGVCARVVVWRHILPSNSIFLGRACQHNYARGSGKRAVGAW